MGGVVTTYVCGTYNLLITFGPAVATLIIASALFMGVFTKHVAMGAVFVAIVMALVIGMFPTVLGSLSVHACGS